MSSGDFELEVTFPENPLDIARMYFAVMAYPERGAGRAGGAGSEFASALVEFAAWAYRKEYGLRATARDISFLNGDNPPQWRDFEGALERGLRRIERRWVVLMMYNRRMLSGVGRSGDQRYTISSVAAATPKWGEILNRDVHGWAKRASLNQTGIGTPDDTAFKAKDFKRRTIRPSLPVLHLAHGLYSVMPKAQKFPGWGQIHPLLALYISPDLWVYDALAAADNFRLLSAIPGFHAEITEADLIRLHWQKPAG